MKRQRSNQHNIFLIKDRPVIAGDSEISLPAVFGQSVSMDCKAHMSTPLLQFVSERPNINITWSKVNIYSFFISVIIA